jgi:[protein-PII] uridylyltransferase
MTVVPQPSSTTLAAPVEFDAGLFALLERHGPGAALKPAVLVQLKAALIEGRRIAQDQLDADNNGRRCAASLSGLHDRVIAALFLLACEVYHAGLPSDAQHMSVIATGGYGRGLLAPKSDIDLLFLLPYKQTPWGESVAEFMLYILWDLGLKVGHATRSVDQCLQLARADMTIRTSLLDSRHIAGSTTLASDLKRRFRAEFTPGTAPAFVEAKLAERDERHRRTGESRYRVEPNIKDGKGGLRDLHTLHWLVQYVYGRDIGVAGEAGLFTHAEYRNFRLCEDFLWTVRCHLHFLANRPEERLTFDLQPPIAEKLGYKERGGLRTVERFMKQYFMVAREVGELTLAASAALEMQQVKTAPIFERLLAPLTWRTRAKMRRTTDFRVENGRLDTVNDDIFKLDPVNIIRIFRQAEAFGTPLHPAAVRLLRQARPLIDDTLRANPDAARIFLDLLTEPKSAERVLRSMNETGVLGRYIPEFGRIVSMMQFNMYHHYTVDEHSILAVGLLGQIEQGTLGDDHPLASDIIKQVQSRRVLYLAVLLHDTGKRLEGDHSVTGAAIAREVAPRFGFTPAETETVAWLIEQHLTMSIFAQSRDLSDPKTISDFAAIVQSPERLRLLLILTVADIRAVGPGVWNGWKGQLLRTLYFETEPVLAGGHTKLGQSARVVAAQDELRRALPDWPAAERDRVIARLPEAYWLRTDTGHQVEHVRLLRDTELTGKGFAYQTRTDKFTAVTELTVLASDAPRLLSLFAGACAATGANIMGASISTTTDDMALDTFLIKRELDEEDELRLAARIGETIGKLLDGSVAIDGVMARRRPPKSRSAAFRLLPEVVINNQMSARFTVIEVSGLDRSGLLYDLTSALSDLGLDINSAHIATYGERAVDVFYVTDLQGAQVADEEREERIRARLGSVFAVPG